MNERSKVYVEILKQIRQLMQSNQLQTGDKIPSERELAERLNAGRSSVREALRALELLGLIETRRGEGTFIKEVGDHQLIEILATFLLHDSKPKEDLIETKYMLERACLESILQNNESIVDQLDHQTLTIKQLFEQLFRLQHNRLLHRIWLIVSNFYYTFQQSTMMQNQAQIALLIHAIKQGNEHDVFAIHKGWYHPCDASQNVE
ncbi:GntR family transcriptional regulator [Priestia flexa]|jgi:GntR family transcriptional regulator, transcriptional repressor for pyruvate dehydrogenase complex|uniref:FadR family transcriptional regulator n=1 Tax=Priestia flexa TaxID=86664 RepID=A0A8I1MD16_9BACI|nr:GntR family transcriptional regulator [Priestia flexa]MBN8250677.1 FadR family transcriptional regulator [Priestia flexa]MBN8432501.1 FadR family transcriptional regulator [Priestia flexa]MCA0965514.1 GntR family transcriptional regulator [Priestia flexa]UIR29565.1 GntR family transcriptional regulator [Priestia flexa]